MDKFNEDDAMRHLTSDLTAEEEALFQELLESNDAARETTRELSHGLEVFALTQAPTMEPSSDLRTRILDAAKADDDTIVPMPGVAKRRSTWSLALPWAAAACLAFFVGKTQLDKRDLRIRNTALREAVSELSILRNQVTNLQGRLANATDSNGALSEQLAAATSEVANLQEQVTASDLRIRDLESNIDNSYKAYIVWDDVRNTGVLRVENLPVLDAASDYQLWVKDANVANPVDGGVFIVNQDGATEFQITTKQPVDDVKLFAITKEVKGGVAVSAGPFLLAAEY